MNAQREGHIQSAVINSAVNILIGRDVGIRGAVRQQQNVQSDTTGEKSDTRPGHLTVFSDNVERTCDGLKDLDKKIFRLHSVVGSRFVGQKLFCRKPMSTTTMEGGGAEEFW